LRGQTLLGSPRLNKGTAFSAEERKTFGLEGRLPYCINTLSEQCTRAYAQHEQRDTPMQKNTFLQSLKDQNWTLYYSLLARHMKELTPIIYTPTEAEAITSYSHIFQHSKGLYLSYPEEDLMEQAFLEQMHGREIDLIVVMDVEAILRIGDQGV
ncbi:Aminoacid dehydrogenase-like protein, partial [Agrocybe pediades]